VSLNLGLYSGLAVSVIVVTKYRVPGYQSRGRTQDEEEQQMIKMVEKNEKPSVRYTEKY